MTDKKSESSSKDYPEPTQPVIDLLTKILNEFSNQVQTRTPPPLKGGALEAANVFKAISDLLNVKPAKSAVPSAN